MLRINNFIKGYFHKFEFLHVLLDKIFGNLRENIQFIDKLKFLIKVLFNFCDDF